ncbi:DUF429 domain-containing protein [Rhodospirillaceae bacterium SYSU D60014]|uniref:DUF429 domain-containing protein n=1 Tax=Virgifigura deserti TaxID=2268457 RepID=UPI000E672AF4
MNGTAGIGMEIFGVDFSGAEAAGRAIWVAAGRFEYDSLYIESCRPGAELPGSGVGRAVCLAALARFIAQQKNAAFGLDFPFSLAAPFIGGMRWEDYVRNFAMRYPTADAFRQACRGVAGGRELKRATDRVSRVPFAAYNLRLYRQTYYGIRDLLAPLVQEESACILPMQAPIEGKPWLFEICPASTLKAMRFYPSYKGRDPLLREARQRILDELVARGALMPLAAKLEERVLDDPGGDALDSVIAAVATGQAAALSAESHRPSQLERVEGRVYFAATGTVKGAVQAGRDTGLPAGGP